MHEHTWRCDQTGSLRKGITFDRLTVALLFIALFARACHSPAQNDTWWHLRTGEDIWHGLLPTTDRFTYTAHGRFWPDHEWLSQAVFFALHTAGGMAAVTLYVAVVLVATYALLWRLMGGSVRRRALLLVATLPATLITSAVRPQVVSLLLLLVLVWLLIEQRFRLVPVVFLLWANMHGAFVLGAFVLVVVLVVAFIWQRELVRPLAIATAISAVATMLTPLGPRVITLVLGMTNEVDIVEWRPAWDTMPAGAILGVVAIVFFIAWRARPPREWADRVLVAGSVAMLPLAVRYSRVIPMFIVLALPVIARAWEARRPAPARSDDESVLHSAAVMAVALGATIWVIGSWATSDPALAWDPLPPAAAEALRSCDEPVFNRFDDGGYLIWFAPDIPVFIDSRVDPFPKEFLRAAPSRQRRRLRGDVRRMAHRMRVPAAALDHRPAAATGWLARDLRGRRLAGLRAPVMTDYAFLDWPEPIAFAHRGGASEAPENTMPAFEHAVRLGYRYIETDVHVTADGVLLAFHDDVLDRVTDGHGRVDALPWSVVQEAKVDGREPIPLFEDLLGVSPTCASTSIRNTMVRCRVGRCAEAMQRPRSGVHRSLQRPPVVSVRVLLGPTVCTSLGPRGIARLRSAVVRRSDGAATGTVRGGADRGEGGEARRRPLRCRITPARHPDPRLDDRRSRRDDQAPGSRCRRHHDRPSRCAARGPRSAWAMGLSTLLSMGSRSAPPDTALPAVEIESFSVERLQRPHPRRVEVTFRPPGYAYVERLRHKYEVAIGAYRSFDPRRHSTVEHRVGHRADDVIDALRLDDAFYDSVEHEFRVPVDLHLPWSWPDLPMWLSVGELSPTMCTLRLSLRSRRRLRYPKRYFNAAHAAVSRLESEITSAAARWGSGSSPDPAPA